MKSVRILFCLIVILPLALSLTGCGKHSLTMAVTGSGTTDPPVGATTYKDKETVTMTAAAAAGWTFDHWEGDVTGSANPATCQISADMHVTAVFVQQQVTLTVTAEGSGSANPSVGTHSYAVGTAVMIAATAAAGWRFDHWEGDLTGAANPASLTMDADKSVKAVFVQDGQNYTLTTAVSGTGTVDPSAGTHSYASGASVTVTAAAGGGWSFDHWTGDLAGSANPATLNSGRDIMTIIETPLSSMPIE